MFTMRPADSVPTSAMTAPTDRSMPPVRMTKVMPTARMPTTETCRSTFMMLLTLKKLSLASPIRIDTTIRPARGRASGERSMALRLKPPVFAAVPVFASSDMFNSPGGGVCHYCF